APERHRRPRPPDLRRLQRPAGPPRRGLHPQDAPRLAGALLLLRRLLLQPGDVPARRRLLAGLARPRAAPAPRAPEPGPALAPCRTRPGAGAGPRRPTRRTRSRGAPPT